MNWFIKCIMAGMIMVFLCSCSFHSNDTGAEQSQLSSSAPNEDVALEEPAAPSETDKIDRAIEKLYITRPEMDPLTTIVVENHPNAWLGEDREYSVTIDNQHFFSLYEFSFSIENTQAEFETSVFENLREVNVGERYCVVNVYGEYRIVICSQDEHSMYPYSASNYPALAAGSFEELFALADLYDGIIESDLNIDNLQIKIVDAIYPLFYHTLCFLLYDGETEYLVPIHDVWRNVPDGYGSEIAREDEYFDVRMSAGVFYRLTDLYPTVDRIFELSRVLSERAAASSN